ncbi:GMC family oxidoreductase [Amaricoccus macauensis]|uniref:GMC family oxidoreductase n=1 Tax=Amaricoccus macauensis TaxID=57001 RepID=UPI003C7E3C05
MKTRDFDYVIVGAGSAGCVLADRLSAGGRHSVLILEAGGSDRQFWIKVPVGYAINYAKPALNWGYHTDSEEGLNGRICYWPRGRVIGGSSSINAMTYVRGQPRDFDDWAAAGATGWAWDTVRAIYERMECHSGAPENGGPVWVQDLSDQMNPFARRFLKAARDAGYLTPDDMNADGAEGISYYRSNVRSGMRWSAADAFLRPALLRGNLTLEIRAHVSRLTFDGSRADGLVYEQNGEVYRVRARREVILSAGAINSPQLLQLSGIGPAELLRSHGVEVRRDLTQVGEGLQDHLAVSFQFRATCQTLNNVLGRPLGRAVAGLRYALTRRGPLAVPVNQVGGFVRSEPRSRGPDVQLFCNPASYEITPEGRVVIDRDPGYLLSAQPCRPTSRGSVRIRSADYREVPVIRPNSLGTEEDRYTALRGTKIIRALSRTPALRAVTSGCKTAGFETMDDVALLEEFRARASTVFHPTCTCRMGEDPKKSVTDTRLRVHGVPGLRVVDASVFPNITSGNTNAPTMMLALRASDLILQETEQAAAN